MKRLTVLVLLVCGTGSAPAQEDSLWRSAIEDHIERMDAEFKDPAHSPLTEEDRAEFTHLDRFGPDPAYVVQATFRPAKRPVRFGMRTSTDRTPEYEDIGVLHFRLKGRKCRLHVYRNVELARQEEYRNALFVPFTDASNGEESYGGGRYLDLEGPLGRTVEVDFNRAYNPYCAYNARYSCPVPPRENHLDLPVHAGVRSYKAH